MNDSRQGLHELVDALPEDALQHAEQALKYCANPAEKRFTIEHAKRRA